MSIVAFYSYNQSQYTKSYTEKSSTTSNTESIKTTKDSDGDSSTSTKNSQNTFNNSTTSSSTSSKQSQTSSVSSPNTPHSTSPTASPASSSSLSTSYSTSSTTTDYTSSQSATTRTTTETTSAPSSSTNTNTTASSTDDDLFPNGTIIYTASFIILLAIIAIFVAVICYWWRHRNRAVSRTGDTRQHQRNATRCNSGPDLEEVVTHAYINVSIYQGFARSSPVTAGIQKAKKQKLRAKVTGNPSNEIAIQVNEKDSASAGLSSMNEETRKDNEQPELSSGYHHLTHVSYKAKLSIENPPSSGNNKMNTSSQAETVPDEKARVKQNRHHRKRAEPVSHDIQQQLRSGQPRSPKHHHKVQAPSQKPHTSSSPLDPGTQQARMSTLSDTCISDESMFAFEPLPILYALAQHPSFQESRFASGVANISYAEDSD